MRPKNSTATKKPHLSEPSAIEDEELDEDIGNEESDEEKPRKKAKGRAKAPAGGAKGKPKKGAKAKEVEESEEEEEEEEIEEEGEESDGESEGEATAVPGTSPTEKEFTSGAFVVLKTDFKKGGNESPIWRIDGKSLLQKYIPFEEDGKTFYKSTSAYSGWSENNKDQYYAASIVFKTQNKKETVVEFLRDAIKE